MIVRPAPDDPLRRYPSRPAPARRARARARRGRRWPGAGDMLLLALVMLLAVALALRWRGVLVVVLPPPWDPPAVTAPDPRFPYRIRHAPTITRATYRAVLESIQHPLAPDADAVYTVLGHAGVDPAIALALALLSDPPPGDGAPGAYNLYGVVDPDGAPVTYASYRAAVGAWVVWLDQVVPRPEPPDAPLTVAGLVALVCAEPVCVPTDVVASVADAVDRWRAQDRSARKELLLHGDRGDR